MTEESKPIVVLEDSPRVQSYSLPDLAITEYGKVFYDDTTGRVFTDTSDINVTGVPEHRGYCENCGHINGTPFLNEDDPDEISDARLSDYWTKADKTYRMLPDYEDRSRWTILKESTVDGDSTLERIKEPEELVAVDVESFMRLAAQYKKMQYMNKKYRSFIKSSGLSGAFEASESLKKGDL